MKVLFQHQGLITDTYRNFFRTNLPEDMEIVFPDSRDPEILLQHAPDTDIFVAYTLTPEFLSKATKLKHIQIPWTGFNSMKTDLLADYPNVSVSNSHSNSLSIAEHAVALMFSAAKLIVYRDSFMRKGDWGPRYQDENSFWLTGRKLGIVGYGAIGKKVAKMLKFGFDMEVLAIKRNPSAEKDEYCAFLGGPQDLEYVLKESDFLLVAMPLTSETEGMIGAKELELMKSTAVVVNIARGAIIDEGALYTSLRDHKIGAAGIDVWYNYPEGPGPEYKVDQNQPFEELDNIVMSPHSAFKVRDRVEIFAQDILENIKHVYNNEEPKNQVNLRLGY